MTGVLKAPFPYFGGKSKVATLVWERFGNVSNYVEPFCGSCAMLLARPSEPRIETVNDADGFIANFWRALAADPEAVAHHADWPVNELDMIARNRWLQQQADFIERMKTDPDFYDVKIAGWWVWGKCAWIAEGWCKIDVEQKPHLGDAGMGITRRLPHLNAGMGINRKLPHLSAGRGINRKLPHLGDAGRGEHIREYFTALAARLRDVRVCCGDWKRVTGDTVTWRHGITGVFLDPPYYADCYAPYNAACAPADVQAWCIEAGARHDMRIALCGYEGAYEMPADWECVPWKTHGGYGSRGTGRGRDNAGRERIWFSPACLKTELF